VTDVQRILDAISENRSEFLAKVDEMRAIGGLTYEAKQQRLLDFYTKALERHDRLMARLEEQETASIVRDKAATLLGRAFATAPPPRPEEIRHYRFKNAGGGDGR
jgi:hypothetical protein